MSTSPSAPSVLAVNGFSNALRVFWDVVVTALTPVIFVVELIAGTVVSLFLFLVEFLFSIPILGRFLRLVLSLAQTILWRLVGILEAIAWVARIRPAKKLRIRVISLNDGTSLTVNRPDALREVQKAIDVFYDQANVRVVPDSPISFRTPFHRKETAGDRFVSEMRNKSSDSILDVRCGIGGFGEDLWVQGFWFNQMMARWAIWGNARRLIGYGGPVVVFAVKTMPGASGCSMGPLTDYVTIRGPETSDSTTVAHEVGHCCGLWHVGDPQNLMYRTDSNARRELTSFQAIVLRNSRHVTYL